MNLLTHQKILTIIALAFSCFTTPGAAQVWLGTPGSGDWHTSSNWAPNVVPNSPTASAGFAGSSVTNITINSTTTVDRIVFDPSASAYTLTTQDSPFVFDGDGVINSSGMTQNFVLDGSSSMDFTGSADAGSNVLYLVQGNSQLLFTGTASAANARIINNASLVSGLFVSGNDLEVCEFSGTGMTTLGGSASSLTVGGLNTSAAYSGDINQTSFSDSSVTKVGTGTWTLSGNSNYSGGTTVSGGTLALNSDNAAGTGGITLNGGNLAVGNGVTIANNITVSGGEEIEGAGFTGTISGNIFLDGSGVSFAPQTAANLTISGAITGSGGLNVDGVDSGRIILTNNGNTFTGTHTITTGGIQVGNGGTTGSLGSGDVVLDGFALNAFLTYDLSANTTVDNNINSTSGTGRFFHGGSGELVLNGLLQGSLAVNADGTGDLVLNNGLNSYTGFTNVTTGTLVIGATGATGNGDIRVAGGTGIEYADAVTENNRIELFSNADLTVGTGDTAVQAGDIDGSDFDVTKQGGGTLVLTGTNGYDATTIQNGILQIGNSGTTGTLGTGDVVNNAALTFDRSNALTVANNISGTGDVIQNGEGTTTLTGSNTYDGATNVNQGTLRVASGGEITLTNSMNVGQFAGQNGTFEVSGTGSTVNVDTVLLVGGLGTGELTVEAGGVVTSNTVGLGSNFGGMGKATVTGSGSRWNNNLDFNVGRSGTGILNIEAGGLVTNRTGILGRFEDSEGTATVTGSGSIWRNSADVSVGSFGEGTLTVADGGVVEAENGSGSPGTIFIAGGMDAEGTLHIGNGGNAGVIDAAGTHGGDGDATLNFNHNEGDYFFTNDGTSGGAAVLITGSTELNHIGSGTTTLIGANTYTGETDVSGGMLVVGAGSSITHTGAAVRIADGGGETAMMVVRDGGMVHVRSALLGAGVNSDATLTVNGAGSQWTSDSFISVGRNSTNGTGTLNVENGGVVNSSRGDLGDFPDATGTATITGTGSTWNNTNSLAVGNTGMGTLNIEAGGLATSADGTLGTFSDATGIATVTGTNSRWNITDELRVGGFGTGTLNIEDGGQVTSTDGFIGSSLNATGTATITGTGSTLDNTASLIIGNGGTGTLTLAEGGTVIVDSGTAILEMAIGSLGEGTINIGTGAGAGIINAAVVRGGSGDATLNFNHNESEYFLTTDGTNTGSDVLLTGSLEVNHGGTGVTTLRGASTYDGGTTITGGTLLAGNTTGSATGTGAVAVQTGGTLGGDGFIGGQVTIQDGGTLAPGTSPGTLTINNNLVLNNASILDYELDTPGIVGSGINDLTVVNGNLTLDGILNITDLGGFGDGTYRLFDYTGSLTDNGLNFGVLPGLFDLTLDTATANQINLEVAVATRQFWDGSNTSPNGTIDGGTGTWDAGTTNWTNSGGNANALWTDGLTAAFAGSTGTVTIANGFTAEVGGLDFLTDGYTLEATGTGALSLTGAVEANVDTGLGVTISAPIGGTGSLEKTGEGTLTLTGTSSYTGGTVISFGTLEVDGGSIATPASDLFVGDVDGDIGTLMIQNGGTVSISNGTLGVETGSMGTATVTGAGSLWTSSVELKIGESGTGTLNVEDGGMVSSDVSNVGLNAGGVGMATVTGAGSQWNNSNALTVGSEGMGTLEVREGGVVTSLLSNIGNLAGSLGIATVTGAGSQWTMTNFLDVGDGGTGILTIEAGGLVSSASGDLGVDPDSMGTVTVTGPGSQWTNTDSVEVGRRGTGILNIEAGGVVSNTDGILGEGEESIGTATVTGAGSQWSNSGNLIVGDEGMGTLRIEDGGVVTNNGGVLGQINGASGSATVTGAGSQWNNTGNLVVGSASMGMLRVENGGVVSSGQGLVGNGPTGEGEVTVTGAGSQWNVTGDLVVSFVGEATINVLDGGSLSSAEGLLGFFPGSTSTMTVSGSGSQWNTSGNITVGNGGTGTLIVDESATVGVNAGAGTVTLASGASAAGTLNIGSGGGAGIINAATINGGGGSAMLNFNHNDADYHFTTDGTSGGTAIAIDGTTIVNLIGAGTTTLSAASTYTGGTTVAGGTLLANSMVGSSTGTGSVTVRDGGTLGGNGMIGGPVTIQDGGVVAPGTSIGTLAIDNNLSFSDGSLFSLEGGGSLFDRLDITGTVSIAAGAEIAFSLDSPLTEVNYTLATAAGGFDGAVEFTLSGALPTGYRLQYNDTSLDLIAQGTIGAIVATPADATIITGGSTSVEVTVQNIGPTGGASLMVEATGDGDDLTGSGTATVAPGDTEAVMPDLDFSSTTIGSQTGTVTVTDSDAANSPQEQTVNVTVLDHADPDLNVDSGNNQTVIVGAAGISSDLNLANGSSGETGLSPLDVSNLSSGLSGATGSGVIASGASGTYTASLDTSTVGQNQSQTFSLDAGDQQSLPGANPLTTQSADVTINVLDHADPDLNVTSGDNQTVIVGATGITAQLNLSNGNPGDTDLAPLDVSNLSSGLSGTTGSGVIASGASGIYMATLNTSAVGQSQVQTFSLQTGDQQSLPGADPLGTQSANVTLNVMGHADPSISGNTLSLAPVHAGYAIDVTSNSQTVTNGSTGDFIADLKADPVSNDNLSINGVSGLGPGESASITATLAPGRSAGLIDQTFTYTFDDDSTLPGAMEGIATTNLQVTGLVYTGQGVWTQPGGGTWGSLTSNFGANWETLGGSPGLDPNFTNTDGATFGSAGNGLVTLDGVSPSLQRITFDNSTASYHLAQGSGSGALTMQGNGGAATIEVLAGTHQISAPVNLSTDTTVEVASETDSLLLNGPLQGSGGLTKNGAGMLELQGTHSYTGPTQVNAGTFVLNGTITSPVSVAPGVTFGGTGTIQGNLVNNGFLSPGNSPGVLTITGDLTLNSGGTLQIEVAGRNPGEFDRIDVAGTATLGGTLAVSFLDGFTPEAGETFTFLTAGGGVNGEFEELVSNFPGALELSITQTGVTLVTELRVTPLPYTDYATTPNQLAVARALDAERFLNPNGPFAPFTIVWDQLPTGELPLVFSELAPTQIGSTVSSTLALSQANSQRFANRMAILRAVGVQPMEPIFGAKDSPVMLELEPHRYGLWFEGGGTFADVTSIRGSRGYALQAGMAPSVSIMPLARISPSARSPVIKAPRPISTVIAARSISTGAAVRFTPITNIPAPGSIFKRWAARMPIVMKPAATSP